MPRNVYLVPAFERQTSDFQEIVALASPLNVQILRDLDLATEDDVVVSTRRNISCKGTVYCAKSLGKLEELTRLEAGGVRVPKTSRVEDHVPCGRVIVKPRVGMQGRGVALVDDVAPYLGRDFLAQQYIPTGSRATKVRMLTLFGKILYSVRVTNRAKGSLITSSPKRRWKPVLSSKLEKIARDCYAAVPDVPAHAVDVVTDVETGLNYVLEINARGRIWHLSTRHGRRLQKEIGYDLYSQGALKRAAAALKEKFL